MNLSRLSKRLFGWVGRPLIRGSSGPVPLRGAQTHVIILDGTMSSLRPGHETNAGLTYRLMSEMGDAVSVYYEAGVQWTDWRSTLNVMMGVGINRQIRRAYGFLAARYRPGDRIYLMGFSRGAYAVRSLAGVIDRVGLLRAEHVTARNIETAYLHYRENPSGPAASAFARVHCHDPVQIEMIGVWDTVKALGLRLPLLWKLTESRHGFHNHHLGRNVRNGFHALALDETRDVYAPVLWDRPENWEGRLEQVWFRGTHGDVGGQLSGFHAARPLANIPLVWMLDRAESCGLPLPDNWRDRFVCDLNAPSMGLWMGWAKIFLLRHRRTWGTTASERLYPGMAPANLKPLVPMLEPILPPLHGAR
ncbi:MAG: DUF2235 domain-containing protein [Rhodobacteraceae bacterium]|nr:DUF2235 domain-containing protein [Paracoccaceae bacterium]